MIIIIVIIVAIIGIAIIANKKGTPKPKTDYYSAAQYSLSRDKKQYSPNRKTSTSLDIKFKESKNESGKYLIVDCETTGLPKSRNASIYTSHYWPRIVQLAWFVFDNNRNLIKSESFLINPGIDIPKEATRIHNISTEKVQTKGKHPILVLRKLKEDLELITTIVAHNIDFDIPIIESEFIRTGFGEQMRGKDKICTMVSSTKYLKLPPIYWGDWKWPKLEELTGFLFFNNYDAQIPGLHDAEMDAALTAKCFFKLLDIEEVKIIVNKGQKNFTPNELNPLLPSEIIIPKKQIWPRKNEKLKANPELLKTYNSLRNKYFITYNNLYSKIGIYNLVGSARKNTENNLKDTINNIDVFLKEHF